ncbi:MAG TPA: hypothetical protein VG273_16535 [Bryobacteraceae bacterium]|jgi:hypothetical protein|nr:hypothetical protein [Bryobacteraceae bacterium]
MQLSAMQALCSQRLNEASGAAYYPTAEITAAINEMYRFFVLLTLGLETTASWTPATGTTFFRMLTAFSDWIAPLRITNAAGQKVRPGRLEDLSSLDSAWVSSAGSPTRYVALGVDLVGLYKQPAISTTLKITYAKSPAALSGGTDVPLIPAEYHPKLVDGAIYRLRQVEGASEFAKTKPLMDGFLDAATAYGNYVRARNLGSRYDKVPFELEKFDRSKLYKFRPDLTPARVVKDVDA